MLRNTRNMTTSILRGQNTRTHLTYSSQLFTTSSSRKLTVLNFKDPLFTVDNAPPKPSPHDNPPPTLYKISKATHLRVADFYKRRQSLEERYDTSTSATIKPTEQQRTILIDLVGKGLKELSGIMNQFWSPLVIQESSLPEADLIPRIEKIEQQLTAAETLEAAPDEKPVPNPNAFFKREPVELHEIPKELQAEVRSLAKSVSDALAASTSEAESSPESKDAIVRQKMLDGYNSRAAELVTKLTTFAPPAVLSQSVLSEAELRKQLGELREQFETLVAPTSELVVNTEYKGPKMS